MESLLFALSLVFISNEFRFKCVVVYAIAPQLKEDIENKRFFFSFCDTERDFHHYSLSKYIVIELVTQLDISQ